MSDSNHSSPRSWFLSTRSRRRRFQSRRSAEHLETRRLLTGLVWSDSTNITISFAADGTDVAGNKSELFADLSKLGTTAQWQSTVVRGFQTWLDQLGYSIRVVADSGAPFGVAGATHNDSRFGDVRVAAVPLTSGVLATAIPRDTFISGTWAGDVMLNSTIDLKSLDELYALSLHEAGHVLGLEHSTDPKSPMFDHGGTVVLAPTTQDIQTLRGLYAIGSNTNAAVEKENQTNNRPDDAEELANVQPVGMYPRFEVNGTLQSRSDVDHYTFRPKSNGAEDKLITTISLRMKGSTRVPEVTILDTSGRVLEYRVIASGNGMVVLQTSEAEAENDYVVKVSATGRSETVKGQYELTVSFSEKAQSVEQLGIGILDREKTKKSYDLYSEKSQLVNFLLDTRDSSPAVSGVAAVLSIYDLRNHLVFRAVTRPGGMASNNTILLGAGKYHVQVEVLASDRTRIREIAYAVSVAILNSDAGPLPANPVGKPVTAPQGSYPIAYPGPFKPGIPVVLKPPVVTRPPVTTGTTGKPAVPKLPPSLTWQKLITSNPWLTGG